jgi:hypothetical protein
LAEERERVVIPPKVRRCIESTSECYTVCAETIDYCLNGARVMTEPEHVRFLIDCCEVCQTTQNTLLRASELGIMMAAVCVEACEQLAASLRAIDGDDQLEACAEVCDRTANCCSQLAI